MNWKVGDRAIILRSKFPERVGETVTIMSGLMMFNPFTGKNWSSPSHFIDLPAKRPERVGEPAAYRPDGLGPIPDNYDGLEISSWNKCVFKPKVTV